MGRRLRPHLLFAALAGLAGLCLSGCLGGYVLPTVALTPGVRVVAGADDIHVIRVDVADDENCDEFADHDRYVLHPVPLTPDGTALPQVNLGLDYGWLWNCVLLGYSAHTHHTLMLRVYRPGWRTVQIPSWQLRGRVKWEKAPDLAAQEKAVDDLVSTWETDFQGYSFRKEKLKGLPRPADANLFRCLAPGSASRSHQATLLFAASEYDRLALLIPPPVEDEEDEAAEAVRARLTAKAEALRRRASPPAR